jgi:hypothetical protein
MRFSPDLHATVLQDSGSLTLICDGSLKGLSHEIDFENVDEN